jgi:hypothetical protein
MASTKRSLRSKKGTRKSRNTDTIGPVHETTYHGLNHWHKHLFEQLGWMILAKKYGYSDKVHTYKHSILRLKKALEMKLADLDDPDKKKDIKILWDQVCILHDHVKRDFH